MSESLEFAESYNYDTLKTGISLPVVLQSGENQLEIHAKLDTGSTHYFRTPTRRTFEFKY